MSALRLCFEGDPSVEDREAALAGFLGDLMLDDHEAIIIQSPHAPTAALFDRLLVEPSEVLGLRIATAPTAAEAMGQHGLLYPVQMFAECGRNVFHVGPRLAELLAHTDLSKMPIEAVRSPYSGFAIDFGPAGHGLTSAPAPIRGAFVGVDGDMLAISWWWDGGTCQYLRMPLDMHKTWDAAFAWALRQESPTGYEGLVVDEHETATLLALIVNLALYLSSPCVEQVERSGADRNDRLLRKLERNLTRAKKRGNARQTRKARKKMERWRSRVVIRHVDLAPSIEHVGPPSEGSRRAHWVRGFWRHQAHGPRFSSRRWIWVRPHVRGIGSTANCDGRDYRFESGESGSER